MKNKEIGMIMSIGALMMTFGFVFVANGNFNKEKAHADANEYVIVLDANNGAVTEDGEDDYYNWSKDSIISIEYRDKTIDFGSHFLAPGRAGEWATMKNDWEDVCDEGMLYNITPLYGIKSITIVHENLDEYPGWNIYWGFDDHAVCNMGTFPLGAKVEEYDDAPDIDHPETANITYFDFNGELPNYFCLDAFNGTEAVESITIEYSCSTKTELPDYYQGFNEKTIYSLNSDGESYCLKEYKGTDISEIDIPTEYRGLPVTKIGGWAFDNHTEITKVVIPEQITEISSSAFRNISIEEIIIPSSVQYIDSSAFVGCTQLEKVFFNSAFTNNCSSQIFGACGTLKVFYGFDNYETTDNPYARDMVIKIGSSTGSNITHAYNQTLTDFESGEFNGDSYFVQNNRQYKISN